MAFINKDIIKNRSTVKSAILLIGLTTIAKIFGFAREIVLSYIYGASSITDAFITGSSMSDVLFTGITGAIMVSYLPIGARIKHEKEQIKFTSNMLNCGTLLILVVISICIIFIKPLTKLFAAGYTGSTFNNTVIIGIFALLSSVFLYIINILNGYLNIKNYFSAFAIQSIISNCIMILVFSLSIKNSIFLGFSFFLSLLIPTIIIILISKSIGYKYQLIVNPKDEQIRRVISNATPIFASQIAVQLNLVISRSFASTLDVGIVSSMKYASLLCLSFNSIFSGAIGSVVFPKLAEEIEQSDKIDKEVEKALKLIILIVLPSIIISILLNNEIIKLIFGHGAFNSKMVKITAISFSLYSIGLLGNGFCEIINRLFYALNKIKATVWGYCTGMLLNILLNIIFVNLWGYKGLAIATSIAATYMMVFLLIYMKKIKIKFYLSNTFLKSTIGCIFMLIIIILTKKICLELNLSSIIYQIVNIIIPVFMGLISYIFILWLIKTEEINFLFSKFTKK